MRYSLFAIIMLIICNQLYASFPVNRMSVKNMSLKHEVSFISETVFITDSQESSDFNILNISPAANNSDDSLEKFGLFVMWLTMGILAMHRWHANKPKVWNILYICTAGGGGIWWLIDGIRIINGDFI